MKRRAPFYGLGLCLVLLLPCPGKQHPYPETSFLQMTQDRPRPSSRRSAAEAITGYEPLLRQYADSIGWDWRLLAAVIYHESRFNNDAQSGKGATGLMQINSPRYSRDTLLIPSVNLSIGTAYLRKLENMFTAATPSDSLKFALAAFNLGDGNVKRLVTRTEEAGLDATRWKDVSRMLPEGHHTVAYVDNVLETYGNYSRQFPR